MKKIVSHLSSQLSALRVRALQMCLFLVVSAPSWALGPARMQSTQAIQGLAGEATGPLAYGLSLIMIATSAVGWYKHHHDMGVLGSGAMGTLFVAGVAMGAASLAGMVPGVSGALI